MCPWFASSIHAERTTTIPPSLYPRTDIRHGYPFIPKHTKATKRLSSQTLWSWWYLSDFPKQAFKSHQIRSHPSFNLSPASNSSCHNSSKLSGGSSSSKTEPNIQIRWCTDLDPTELPSVSPKRPISFRGCSLGSDLWSWAFWVQSTHDPLWELFYTSSKRQ